MPWDENRSGHIVIITGFIACSRSHSTRAPIFVTGCFAYDVCRIRDLSSLTGDQGANLIAFMSVGYPPNLK